MADWSKNEREAELDLFFWKMTSKCMIFSSLKYKF